jgi:lipopolysaccharide export system protein LptC
MKRRDRHSRTVALLKVAFPLAALVLLSTLFLLGRVIETETPIPFADKEIQDRLRDQQITGPFFSGTTADGAQMSFSADKMITLRDSIGMNRAEGVLARLETAQGATFQIQADIVDLDIAGDAAQLEGDVSMATSTGYLVNTPQLSIIISDLDITAPREIEATGPVGTFTAGNMRLFSPKGADNAQMIFSGGVKLVYIPN